MNVPFGDLRREMDELGDDLRPAVDRVLASGWFILGRELEAFEKALGGYLGGTHVLGVASGTEAIQLALMAAGVGHGDFVLTVPNTAVPTASAITACGATPLLVDVDDTTLTMDPVALEAACDSHAERLGGRLKAVVPVHLYGQCADMDPIMDLAARHGLTVVEDACQAIGATYRGRRAGTIGDYGALSFYPSKNLGCYGDGGAVCTRSEEAAARLAMLRNYGQERRYHHAIKGINSRLDEMQAAILSAKLPYLEGWIARRKQLAERYRDGIRSAAVRHPEVMEYGTHAWHLYVVRHPDRDGLMAHLAREGIDTLIHYPIPIHLQRAYADLAVPSGTFPTAEKAAGEILSLPLFPQLTDDEAARVCAAVDAYAG